MAIVEDVDSPEKIFVCDLVDWNEYLKNYEYTFNDVGMVVLNGDKKTSVQQMIADKKFKKYVWHKNGCFWNNKCDNLQFNNEKNTLLFVTDEWKPKGRDVLNDITGIRNIGGRFEANIVKNDVNILLGYYDDPLDAYYAYIEASTLKDSEIFVNPVVDGGTRVDGRKSRFHASFYIHINDIKFGFPKWYNIDARKMLCDDLIEIYPELFIYELPTSKNDKHGSMVERRLSFMASYLISIDDERNLKHLLPSRYLRRKKRENEINMVF